MRRRASGMTITEVLVATSLAGVLALLMAAVHRLIQSAESGSVTVKALDLFEIERRLEMTARQDFEKNVIGSKDPDLIRCLGDLCEKNCPVNERRPLRWNMIPVYLSETKEGLVNVGGAYRLPEWTPCPPREIEVTEEGVKRRRMGHDPACVGRARAFWKIVSHGTVQIEIELGLKSESGNVNRLITYQFPREERLGAWCPYGIPSCPNHIRSGYGDGRCSGQRVSCEQGLTGSVIESASLGTSDVHCVGKAVE